VGTYEGRCGEKDVSAGMARGECGVEGKKRWVGLAASVVWC